MLAYYQSQASILFKEYFLTEPLIPCTSIACGIFACKMVYDLSQCISSYCKGYSVLSKKQQIEWNNRAISTVHAFFITTMSLYLAFWSDLYSDDQQGELILQRSSLSTFVLGVSIGYFLSDVGMIFWFYPDLGGIEYVLHHLVSIGALAYAMFTGEGQFYTFLVLISETTTPSINLRWYLDAAGLKRSKAYVTNVVVIFFTWLIARILLFTYVFYHLCLHYDQVNIGEACLRMDLTAIHEILEKAGYKDDEGSNFSLYNQPRHFYKKCQSFCFRWRIKSSLI